MKEAAEHNLAIIGGTVLFHSNLSSLSRKYLRDVPTAKIVLSCGPKISEAFKKTLLVA